MGGRSESSNQTSTAIENTDQRVAVQDSGIGVSARGDVMIDAVDDRLIDFAYDAAAGAYNLVSQSLNAAVGQGAGNTYDANPGGGAPGVVQAGLPRDAMIIAAIAAAGVYIAMRSK